MSLALKIFHKLPGPARSIAASLRGFQLRSWRYGAETERLVEETLEREHWNQKQWREWQEKRLAYVLYRAVRCVPFYREQWIEKRKSGDRSKWERLENWSLLDKEFLRSNPQAFVAEDCNVRQMFYDHTSGTTGKSLDLWLSTDAVRFWYALFEARCRGWYGVSRKDHWAILGGQLVTSQQQRKPPFWVWNAALKQLYMSSYHLAPDLIRHYVDALRRYHIEYLLGYTSALYEIAQGILQLNQRVKMAVVVANAEPIFAYQREMIEEAFQCKMRETYGMAETVAAASECEHGSMHLWPEAGWLEVFKDSKPQPLGTPGELISTGLINADMPLIRYRTGDSITLANKETTCPCGRTLPLIASVDGRVDDVLYTSDGRAIGRLDPVFKSRLPVREAQIIQETLDTVRVRYVPDVGFTSDAACSLIERLRERLGEVEVILESVQQVPRTANGKFRAVVCNLTAEQKAFSRAQNSQAGVRG